MNDPIEGRVYHAVQAALDKKAFELEVLDLRGITAIADYFIICSASNERQSQAIADEIRERVREQAGSKPLVVEGTNPGHWIVVDYGDFVVHVFTEETRRFYGLERLWGDAPNVTDQYTEQGSPRKTATRS